MPLHLPPAAQSPTSEAKLWDELCFCRVAYIATTLLFSSAAEEEEHAKHRLQTPSWQPMHFWGTIQPPEPPHHLVVVADPTAFARRRSEATYQLPTRSSQRCRARYKRVRPSRGLCGFGLALCEIGGAKEKACRIMLVFSNTGRGKVGSVMTLTGRNRRIHCGQLMVCSFAFSAAD